MRRVEAPAMCGWCQERFLAKELVPGAMFLWEDERRIHRCPIYAQIMRVPHEVDPAEDATWKGTWNGEHHAEGHEDRPAAQ